MTAGAPADAYDDFAWAYDRFWARVMPERTLAALDALLPGRAAAGAAVLDLCCGPGELLALLAGRGCSVVGLDGSPRMLRRAARRAPSAELVLADVRDFDLPERFDVVICAFDSLNHLLAPGELASALRCARAAMRDGGALLCDLNAEAAFLDHWEDDFAHLADDAAVVVTSRYDRAERLGRFHAAVFRPAGGDAWRRTDVTLLQRPYDPREVRAALDEAGLAGAMVSDAEADLGWTGHAGRYVYTAYRRRAAASGR